MGDMEMRVDLAVIGAGPGGYAAAFRAADLGLDVALIDPRPRPGGVCLHEGCIPSKTYLYLAELLLATQRAAKMGLRFAPPEIDLPAMHNWRREVVDAMGDGLLRLAEKRSIQRVQGKARFEDSTAIHIEGGEISRIRASHIIVATGSRPIPFPEITVRPGGRIMDSATALKLEDIPATLLVVGGGYVGLELGTVYAALGSRVTLAEQAERLLPAIDPDLVAPLNRSLTDLFATIHLASVVTRIKEHEDHVEVEFAGTAVTGTHRYDKVLVAMGRQPFTRELGLEHTAVTLNERGFIIVDDQQRTNDPAVFAVGDVADTMMLAHTATREGRIAAEVIAGKPSAYDVRAIPAIIYTDPQIGWCGLSEQQAAREDIAVHIMKFPWKYSGRARTMDATDGLTKVIVEPESGRILGIGVCGRNAEGLIAEGVLAIEMGALAEDMAASLHPHPTLSETESEAAEIFLGSPTHLFPKGTG